VFPKLKPVPIATITSAADKIVVDIGGGVTTGGVITAEGVWIVSFEHDKRNTNKVNIILTNQVFLNAFE
jgi:Ethanolamine utilization protein EutJ (predicted chaperonin)